MPVGRWAQAVDRRDGGVGAIWGRPRFPSLNKIMIQITQPLRLQVIAPGPVTVTYKLNFKP